MTTTGAFLSSLNLPSGGACDRPASTRRFPGGGQYRIEISWSRGRRRSRPWLRWLANVAFRWANPFLVTEVGEIPAEPYAGEIAALDDVRPADKVAAEHGLRDALRRGDTLRSAYDRFGVL